ncbi:MAG: type II toxin-antitoxin system RelE/ParE family toxin [Bryobacteraceae bacterium]
METPAFLSDARSLGMPDAERLAIVTWIAANPAAGDVIEGTGGARKVRFAGKGKGKSGGYRLITFFAGTNIPVFLLNIFAKNEKTDLTARERRVLRIVLADMARAYRSGRKSR